MSAHCLLATHLSLAQLHQKRYGIYRRLAMLADAVRASGCALRIFCVQPYGTEPADENNLAATIAAEVRALWGIDCDIVVGRGAAPSSLPWMFQQALGALNYRWHWLSRGLLDAASLQLLHSELAREPAFVVAHRLPLMNILRPLTPARIPIFFDLDDIEHLAMLRSLAQPRSLRDRFFDLLSVPALLWAEAAALRRARRTFVCSQIDAERSARTFRNGNVYVLPNAIDMSVTPQPTPAAPTLLMLGIYSYGPNADAADWFIDDVFPLIRQQRPDVQAWFAGGAPESLKAYATGRDGVQFLGFVDDLDAVYRDSRVVICPIRQGSGTRVKLVEAAAWAKPIATTTVGAEGLNFQDGVHALFGDDAQRFAAACVRLLDDDALCAQLGANARQLAEKTYDRRVIVQRLAGEFAQALPAPAAQAAPVD